MGIAGEEAIEGVGIEFVGICWQARCKVGDRVKCEGAGGETANKALAPFFWLYFWAQLSPHPIRH